MFHKEDQRFCLTLVYLSTDNKSSNKALNVSKMQVVCFLIIRSFGSLWVHQSFDMFTKLFEIKLIKGNLNIQLWPITTVQNYFTRSLKSLMMSMNSSKNRRD